MSDERSEHEASERDGANESDPADEANERDEASERDGANESDAADEASARSEDGGRLGQRLVEAVRRSPDPCIGALIAIVYVAILLATARSLGFSRDEGFYFQAATSYETWFRTLLETPAKAFDRRAIDPIWTNNHEHPSLMKSLFAISHMLLHEKWRVFEDASTAFRFPGMLMMGVGLWVTYMFGARAYSRRAGLVAALALGTMPRVFYHAHLACFDVPIMAMWAACIYAYWRAETERTIGAVLWVGVVYGLTLETKHNAWMLPAVFLPHALVMHGGGAARDVTSTGRLSLPASLVAMATIGPVIFVALWPWLWNDTIPRMQEYVNFHVHHDYYNIEFLGRTYFGPPSPRSYMPVMIMATVPTATLVLFVVGALDRLRVVLARARDAFFEATERAARPLRWLRDDEARDDGGADLLVLLAIAVAVGPFLLPRTPIFGGTKHWITAYPFLAILAGRGFDLVWKRVAAIIEARGLAARAGVVEAATILVTFSGAIATTAHSHPFGLSTYVPFAGGTAGGADKGLNRQFWGFTTTSLAPWLAANTTPGEAMYIMDTAWASWLRMVDEKRVPPLRGAASPADANLAIVHHEQHMNEVDYNIWTEYRTSTPAYVLTHDGVPIITVYRRAPR